MSPRVAHLITFLDNQRGEVAHHAVGFSTPPSVIHVMSVAGHDTDYLQNIDAMKQIFMG